MPDLVTGEENGVDGGGDDESERASQSSLPLSVSVSKKGGPFLEFSCMAYSDEIVIDSLSVKNPELSEDQIAYEGPDFQYAFLLFFLDLIIIIIVLLNLQVYSCFS